MEQMMEEIKRLYEESIKGDDKSKYELVERFYPLIISSIKKYYNNYSEFEDLVEDGKLIVLECIKDFDVSKNVHFSGFVKTRLRFFYLNKLNSKKDIISLNQKNEEDTEMIDLLESEVNLEEEVINKDFSKRIQDLFINLSLKEREVIIEFYYLGLTVEEISKLHNISYRTVLELKRRAHKKLREQMERYDD
ncbi:sigma-70 family RNA polymerase sigma factor [Soehngenia longivitae]|uniref:Sigma-70 family RNA polymerase sigma factor n=2 Tax=Soehngenia longivitae TaxID=2562294 RepID=A0A4Z0D994_9FIRM|nr:sigma-70 family RNA polymerase sigma factor [Soehngenia longivitae]